MAREVHHYASQIPEPHSSQPNGSSPLVGGDDESEWLHRNDAYQMQANHKVMRPFLVLK